MLFRSKGIGIRLKRPQADLFQPQLQIRRQRIHLDCSSHAHLPALIQFQCEIDVKRIFQGKLDPFHREIHPFDFEMTLSLQGSIFKERPIIIQRFCQAEMY